MKKAFNDRLRIDLVGHGHRHNYFQKIFFCTYHCCDVIYYLFCGTERGNFEDQK